MATMFLLRARERERSRCHNRAMADPPPPRRLAAAAGRRAPRSRREPEPPQARSSSARPPRRARTGSRSPRSCAGSRASRCWCSRSGCRSRSRCRSAITGWVCAARARVDVRAGQRKAGLVLAIAAVALSVLAAARLDRADRRRLLGRGTSAEPRAGARTAATGGRLTSSRVTPNPFIKQYLMTAGPTPVPPAVSQAMAAPMLYHRAPAFVELYERVLAQAALRLPDRERRAGVRRQRLGRDGVRGRQPRAPRHRRCSPAPRASSASAGSSCARPTAARPSATSRAGATRLDPAEIDRLLERERRHRGRLRHAQRDLDRRSSTTSRAIAEVARAPRRDPRRRRRLRPRRGRAAPGRVGHRRRRRRLAEGADVPARARASPRSPSARSSSPPSRPGGRYYFDWGKDAKAQPRATAPSRPPCRSFVGLDVALDMIRERGPRGRARPPRAARPRHARRRRARSASTSTATPTSARPS